MESWRSILIAVAFICVIVYRVYIFRSASKDFGGLPTYTSLIGPLSLLGSILPYSSWNPSRLFIWKERGQLYSSRGIDALVTRPLLWGTPLVFTSSPEVIKQVLGDPKEFKKPTVACTCVAHLGENVVSTQGEDWRRHRRIAAPAFNSTTYANVWETTVSVYKDIIVREKWSESGITTVPDIDPYTRKLAMFIVSQCSFGIPMSWNTPDVDEKGNYSVQHIIALAAKYLLLRGMAPNFLFSLPLPLFGRVNKIYNQFGAFASDLVVKRERAMQQQDSNNEEYAENIRDILGRLVHARIMEGKFSLTNSEIIGNCFILLFAGHETTAHALSATLGLLGLYTDIQDRVYHQIREILGEREATYEDYDSLFCVLSCLYEAIRLYPSVYMMLREVSKDTILNIPDQHIVSTSHQIGLKTGTIIVMDHIGAARNSNAFPKPEIFDPSRWTPTMEHPGFSSGPRVCLGKKFALTEAVAFLTYFLKDWRVEVPLEPGETVEMAQARLFDPELEITTKLDSIPLKLTRRSTN